MECRVAEKEDFPGIENILRESRLPADDCDGHIGNFIVIEQEGIIIGIGGFEACGILGLIRSIVVIPEYRGKGIGREILTFLENMAYDMGITTLYLLTETAENYFKNLGFSVKDRSEVPEAIVKTKQFSELCPASAKVMCREIVRN